MASDSSDSEKTKEETKDGGNEIKLDPKLLQTEQFEELLTCAVCLDR